MWRGDVHEGGNGGVACGAEPSDRARRRLTPVLVFAAGLVWMAAAGTGLHFLSRYSNQPGIPAMPPTHWPERSVLERTTGRPTLVLLLHPRCACSRATVEELDRLLARARPRPTVHALFFTPTDFPDEWEKTDLWERITAIPGVHAAEDPGGNEAGLFNAFTSGQTILYDAQDRLVFSGGITSSRGHAGDNVGSSTILALLTAGEPRQRNTPVFGCSLQSSDGPQGGDGVGDGR